MNPVTRVAVGAAIGATAVLVAHPTSRPYVLAFRSLGHSVAASESSMIPENIAVLPQPRSALEATLWLQVGAERMMHREPISPRNLDSLIEVARTAGQTEPENAYWGQMEAVFLQAAGRREEARAAWSRAARANVWNDYQSARLDRVRQAMISESGIEHGWQSARLYYRRSSAAAVAIHRFGRALLTPLNLRERSHLLLRYETLRNGALIRDGSRAVALGMYGVDLVEASCLRARQTSTATPRKLLFARFELIDALRKQGLDDQLRQANSAFNDNEAWLALMMRENPSETVREWSLWSVFTAALPGSLLVAAGFGYLIGAFGLLLQKRPALATLVRAPLAPIGGLLLGLLVYASTSLPLPAITVVACFSFLAFGPVNERTVPPKGLGPLFDFTMAALAVVFAIFTTLFVVGLTTPSNEVIPHTSAPIEFFCGQTLPLGLAGLVVGLVLLAAPLWAIAQRVSTTHVVSLGLRCFGFDCGALCAFLGIVLVPVAISLDATLTPNLTKVLLNEPIYYFTR